MSIKPLYVYKRSNGMGNNCAKSIKFSDCLSHSIWQSYILYVAYFLNETPLQLTSI